MCLCLLRTRRALGVEVKGRAWLVSALGLALFSPNKINVSDEGLLGLAELILYSTLPGPFLLPFSLSLYVQAYLSFFFSFVGVGSFEAVRGTPCRKGNFTGVGNTGTPARNTLLYNSRNVGSLGNESARSEQVSKLSEGNKLNLAQYLYADFPLLLHSPPPLVWLSDSGSGVY